MRYRPEIDGLRAVAVLPVLFFHAGFDAFRGGFVGVDVFFVISGYLITRVVVERLDEGTFSLGDFYERRARRILPTMMLICVACVPPAWILMRPSEFVFFGESVVAANTFWANVFFWRQAGYFAPSVEVSPLVHTWSLSVEEQFYLLFPLTLAFTHRWPHRVRFRLFAVLALLSLGGSVYGAQRHPGATFYLLPTRAWELGVGVLLGLEAEKGNGLLRRGHDGLALAGVALIAYAVFTFDGSMPFPGHFALVPVLGTAFVIGGATPGTLVARILALPWIVGLGLISYSLYLWHQPLLAFLKLATFPEPSMPQIVGALLASGALSVATYRVVESPFRDRCRIGERAVWGAAAASITALGSFGLLSASADGWPRASERRTALAALSTELGPTFGLDTACDGAFTLDPRCRTGDEPSVVVWGDSYAMHLMDGVVVDLPDAHVIEHTKNVCGPILDLAPVEYPRYPPAWGRGCLDFNRQVFEWLQRTESVELVFLSSTWAHYGIDGWSYLTPDGEVETDRTVLLEAFQATLRAVRELGIEVVVVSPTPRYRHEGGAYVDQARCYTVALRRSAASDWCDFPVELYSESEAGIIAFLREVEHDYPVIWLAEAMCDGGSCEVARQGTLMYRDIGHLTPEGSRRLGTEFHLFRNATER